MGEPAPVAEATLRGPAAYLAATFALGAAGAAVAAALGLGRPLPAAGGVLAAWAIQAAAVWKLVRVLDRGGRVLRVWVAGIGARAGGLALAALAAVLGAGTEVPVAYGTALLAFLLLEAAWLAGRGTARGHRSSGRA